jgi:hypothetical protein
MLEHALAAYLQSEGGGTSKEAKGIMSALKSLAGAFGKNEEESQQIMPAELKTALMAPSGPPPEAGGPPPQ